MRLPVVDISINVIGFEFKWLRVEIESKIMLSKRAITICKIILQPTIITKKMYAILGGLKSGGLLSCRVMSVGKCPVG